jgi:hypothetical protein
MPPPSSQTSTPGLLLYSPTIIPSQRLTTPQGAIAPTTLHSHQDGYNTHHTHFIKEFTYKESNNRINKKPAPLNAKRHAALREQLKEVHFLKPDYADNTKINITGILRKWKA